MKGHRSRVTEAFTIGIAVILAACQRLSAPPPPLTCDSGDARAQVTTEVFEAAEISIQVRSVRSWGRLDAIRHELNGLKRQNVVVLSSAHTGIIPGIPPADCQTARGAMSQRCLAAHNNGVGCLCEISLTLPPQDRSDRARETLAMLAKRPDVGLFPPKEMANGAMRLKIAYFRMIENRHTVSLVDGTEDFDRLVDGVLLLAMERAILRGAVPRHNDRRRGQGRPPSA